MEVFQIFCRYHEKCLKLFKSSKEIESAQCNRPDKLSEEYAMIYVERSIKNIPDKFWTSTELHELFKGNRERKISARDFSLN